ncbi:MAG: efflux RND transporter permease subunit [Gemmatimonadales bacterium]
MTHDPRTEHERAASTHNTARFFVENRHVSWVLLALVVAWGLYGYTHMPKRKDPVIPVRVATAITPWPGTSAEEVEQLVTRQVEMTAAQNPTLHPTGASDYGIKSLTVAGLSIVTIQLAEDVDDPEKEFSDINLKLAALNSSLPQGAGPIQFNSGFGETAALLLTVASPHESEVELALRARDINAAIARARERVAAGSTAALIVALPQSMNPVLVTRAVRLFGESLRRNGTATRTAPLLGAGFAGLDLSTTASDSALLAAFDHFTRTDLGLNGFSPDAWPPIVVRDTAGTEAALTASGGDKYTYRDLDQFTDLITRQLLGVPLVAKVQRSGVLPEQIFLAYDQEQLASYGIQPASIKSILSARNTLVPGGVLQAGDINVVVNPTGSFESEQDLNDVIISTAGGTPVYLRQVANVFRGYQSPPRYLNFNTSRDSTGEWRRHRAISLGIQMRSGEQIDAFGTAVNSALESMSGRLPEDLVLSRTSDQPKQVQENIDLFMDALYEAILLVVVVALIGFWEWRAALLMMLAIPITLAMTFGTIFVLGVDLQQVSVATLILALGLLVDDPVVAGDAIKRDLAAGDPPLQAAWWGPTKLATAILFATITNVVAYLPMLMLTGNQGEFLHSLPIVMATALIASRIVSMTFIPLLGYYILRPSTKPEPTIEERRSRGFTGWYFRVGHYAIEHRRKVLAGSMVFLALGVVLKRSLKETFFPDDVQYLSYVDVWLPNPTALPATNATAAAAEVVIREAAAEFGVRHGKDGQPKEILESITSFIGGGAPRFWFSVTPEQQQQNYAQLIVKVKDKDDTPALAGELQRALTARVPNAMIDVRQLQTNPVPYPIAVRLTAPPAISRDELAYEATLRRLSADVQAILRQSPRAARVRDDWGAQSFAATLRIDPDRANLAGVTNQDVAAASAAGLNGTMVATLREGNKQIPIIARLQPRERATLGDLDNLYVYSMENRNKIPIREVASFEYGMETQRTRRQDQVRQVTVFGFPAPGSLASEVYGPVAKQLAEYSKTLPPGYSLIISGEQAKSVEGFAQLKIVMLVSILMIFLALVLQFRNAVKPLIVFAAVPYGIVGALASLYVTGTSFGFMALLGIVSLIGVIVSHVIVLFDFIEEMHAKGEPLIESLLDAGIVRLRPVLITVGATVLALLPLALHGGPLWQPLCYAQIGGLLIATGVTLILVPVIYAICVLDLKIVKWEDKEVLA